VQHRTKRAFVCVLNSIGSWSEVTGFTRNTGENLNGSLGAGHFTKLVHDGIECGMLHAIGEGITLLEHYHKQLNVGEILRCWCQGSEIRSWLLDLLEEAYNVQDEISEIPASIKDTSKLRWLVNDTIKMGVSAPVITQVMMQMFALSDDKKDLVRAITMMLRQLGD
jgi:6-phosphogluconate dehydrogenase